MNQPIFKVYAISLCAMQRSDHLLDDAKGMLHWEHSPLLTVAESIDSASVEAKLIAFDTWKREDGWSNHSATIVPVTSAFTDQLFGMIQQGIITVKADPTETQQIFRFDENAMTDFDNVISTDEH
jgi:hypothetical protein